MTNRPGCDDQGIAATLKAFPEMKIVTAWVDEGLNAQVRFCLSFISTPVTIAKWRIREQKYIVPGLGG